MKALVWLGADQLAVEEIDCPKPDAGEVLVRASHAGICGTDLHIWHGEHPRAAPPLVMGHEFSGFVQEPGTGVEGFDPGDPVAVYPVYGCGVCHVCKTRGGYICGSLGLIGIDRDGGMGEFVSVPASLLHRLPEGTDMAKAALIEPIAVSNHTMSRCSFRGGTTVAIVGAGPIGAGLALAARSRGAKQVFVSDVSEFRLDVVRKLGCHPVNAARENLSDVVREATDGQGAEFVFEATGIPAAAEGLLETAAIGGTVVIVGVFPAPIPLDLRKLVFDELNLITTRHYTPAEFEQAIDQIATGEVEVAPMITEIYPLDRSPEAFERCAAGVDTEKLLIQVS